MESRATVSALPSRGDFFPLNEGHYLGFASPVPGSMESAPVSYYLEVRGAVPRLGPRVIEVADPESRSFIEANRSGVFLKAASSTAGGAARRFVRPVRLLIYPLKVGKVWTDHLGSGATGIHVRHWVADVVTVKTPTGTYRAFQIERRVWQGRHTPDFTSDGLGRWTYYYAPGVGPVQIGTRWPGVTFETYQLCTRDRPASLPPMPAPVAPNEDDNGFGLTAGLKSLIR
jgi:hypothetical protein